MSHSFTVKFNEEISSILKKVESEIMDKGGRFEGNTESGSFDGKSPLGTIRGEYCSISHNEIEITIKDKPFIVTYSMIESEMKKYFS